MHRSGVPRTPVGKKEALNGSSGSTTLGYTEEALRRYVSAMTSPALSEFLRLGGVGYHTSLTPKDRTWGPSGGGGGGGLKQKTVRIRNADSVVTRTALVDVCVCGKFLGAKLREWSCPKETLYIPSGFIILESILAQDVFSIRMPVFCRSDEVSLQTGLFPYICTTGLGGRLALVKF